MPDGYFLSTFVLIIKVLDETDATNLLLTRSEHYNILQPSGTAKSKPVQRQLKLLVRQISTCQSPIRNCSRCGYRPKFTCGSIATISETIRATVLSQSQIYYRRPPLRVYFPDHSELRSAPTNNVSSHIDVESHAEDIETNRTSIRALQLEIFHK